MSDLVLFNEWWDKLWHAALEQQKKGLSSLVVLGVWVLWTQYNSCVFLWTAPSIVRALNAASEE